MRIILLLLVSLQFTYAYVLFLGASEQKFKCDDKIGKTISLDECHKVEALDTVTICYFVENDLNCRKLFQNDIITLDNVDKGYSILTKIFNFEPNTKVSMGIKRFTEENTNNIIAMPYGSILKPDNNINLDIRDNQAVQVLLLEENQKIYDYNYKSEDKISLDKKLFKNGKKYALHIITKNTTYTGKFDILDFQTTKEIDESLNQLFKTNEDEKIKNMIRAIIYEQYGLVYDKFKILGEKVETSL